MAHLARRPAHAVLLLVLMLTASTAPGDTFYIAPDGSDDAPGTIDAPFATFDHAVALLEPGDTLVVRGGLYLLDGPILLESAGTADAPITIGARVGETPVLDHSANPRHANPPQPRDDDTIAGTRDALGIFIGPNAAWWHLRGLVIREAPYYGIRIYGSDNIIEACVIHDCKAAGLEITGKEGRSPSRNHCPSALREPNSSRLTPWPRTQTARALSSRVSGRKSPWATLSWRT